MPRKPESRDERFHRVAEKRVNEIVRAMRKIGSMGKSGLYAYSDGDVAQMVEALHGATEDMRKRLMAPNDKPKAFQFGLL